MQKQNLAQNIKNHNSEEKLKINWITTSVVLIYPILILFMVVAYCMHNSVGKFEILSAVIAYYLSNISVGIGLHRLWTHASYKAHPILEFILVIISAGVFQGPAIAWAADHHMHHAYADKDLDPHSPLKYKNKLKGFLWAHIGWLIFGELYKRIDKGTLKRLGTNKMLLWQFKYYWQLAVFMNFVLPPLVGYLIGGDLHHAFACYLFVALGRALQQQMTFCVNSLCHFVGTKKYANDSSVDIWWLFPFLLGENWHNFHHAFGKDYRNGHRWYHFDAHKWIIFILSKVGLASNLTVTPKERVNAVMSEMQSNVHSKWLQHLDNLELSALKIVELATAKMNTAEKFVVGIQNNIKVKLQNQNIAQQMDSIRKLKNLAAAGENLAIKIRNLRSASSAAKGRLYARLVRQSKSIERNTLKLLKVVEYLH